jgi:hypothetical protein
MAALGGGFPWDSSYRRVNRQIAAGTLVLAVGVVALVLVGLGLDPGLCSSQRGPLSPSAPGGGADWLTLGRLPLAHFPGVPFPARLSSACYRFDLSFPLHHVELFRRV